MSNSETPTPPSTKPKSLSEFFSDEFKDYRKKAMAEVAQKAIEEQLKVLKQEETN